MWESMRCVACGSHGLKITPTSLFAAPIHTSDRLSSSQMRMWWRMRTLGPGSSYARSCGRPSKYCVLTGALMAGRLAIAAVTSLVTATSDGFWACTQPARRKALSISVAGPSSSTVRGSPSAGPPPPPVPGARGVSVDLGGGAEQQHVQGIAQRRAPAILGAGHEGGERRQLDQLAALGDGIAEGVLRHGQRLRQPDGPPPRPA